MDRAEDMLGPDLRQPATARPLI